MTQPTERRFVMEPRLDAEVQAINDELALKANTADLGEAAYLDQTEFTHIGNLDYAQFDTTYAGGSTAPGQLAWDQANETLQFMLDDHVTLQVGQEHVMRVKNNSGSVAIPERTVVMFAGATGNTIKVAPAVSNGSVNVNYLAGITTEEIPADGFGFVTQLGFINHVNTNAWPVGTILYVDPAVPGGLTATEPDLPSWTMPVAAVTKQNGSAGRMLVRAIPGGSGAGGSSVVISDTVPAGGSKGDLWLDSTDGTLYIYFEDVDGSQWIQVQANSALEGSILSRLGALEANQASQLASATVKVASAAERDAKFPSPVQGNSVFRNDLGYEERYYTAYNVSTNPGGRTPAGWYSGQEGGLVPITPTSISYTGTSASVAASGKISFTNVTDLRLQGIFSSKFDAYVLRFGYKNSAAMEMRCRLMSGSTLMNSAQYAWTGNVTTGGTAATYSGSGIDWFAWAANISGNGNTTDYTISFPQDNTAITRITGLTSNYAGGWQHATFSGGYNLFDVADGFQAYSTSAANFTGWVTVYGYRK